VKGVFTEMARLIKPLIIFAVIVIGAYLAYHYVENRHQRELRAAIEREQTERLAERTLFRSRIAELEEKLAEFKPAPVLPAKIAEAFGEVPTPATPETEELGCERLKQRITFFLGYIQRQSYMRAFQAENGTDDLFQQIVAALSEKRPMVVAEMRDLSSLIGNVAHFYRVLGEDRIKMIIAILQNESDLIEDAMANFFGWVSLCGQCEDMVAPCPPMEVLYEYAGFFLNTLAGRSYLLRRGSKVRCLTTYYSVLIVDKANDESLNSYGIDIRPYIHRSLYETANLKGLVYRERYLRRLRALRDKYQVQDARLDIVY
jgi:hypothetical protein